MLSVCPHDCPSCCSLVVTVEDGRLTSVTGNLDHPFTRGVICGKVREYAERVHSPLRVLTPLRRVGPNGAGNFVPISWDEAVETIADRWRQIVTTDGAAAILPFSWSTTRSAPTICSESLPVTVGFRSSASCRPTGSS